MPSTITLICEYDGHEWQRQSQRGRRPRFCPEHRPEPGETAKPSPLSVERWTALADQYERDLLPLQTDEKHRILTAIIARLRDIRRPDDDQRFIVETGRLHNIIPREDQ